MSDDGSQTLVLGEYAWLVVMGSIAAFIFGFGTGSNDVANAFGTSVGSKTLTLAQAVVIAIIFEFTGALVLGRVSQETISGGIADISAFQTDPEFFAYGMFWALLLGGVWQIIASTAEINVSATHSIIGCVVGFAMAFKGAGAVIWAQEQIVCTGPLVFLSPCEGVVCKENPEALMYKPSVALPSAFTVNPQYLGGTYTVDVLDLYNVSSGLPYSPPIVTVQWLMDRTGLNISLVSESLSSNGTITNFAQPQKVANPITATYFVTFPGYPDPLTVGPADRKVFFNLKTARHDGAPVDCAADSCPITPQKSSPVIPYQMMYETKAPFCNVHSNSNTPFPPYKGVLIIVLSWFFSPVLTGIASAILFNLARFLVLRHENAYKRSFFVLPFMAFLTFWVNIFFVLTKGAAKLLSKEAEGWTTTKAAWICAACAGGISLLSVVIIAPLLYHRVNTTFLKKQEEAARAEIEREAAEQAAEQAAKDRAEKGEPHPDEKGDEAAVPEKGFMTFLKKAKKAALHGMTADMFSIVEDDPLVAAIHKNAEIFDEKAEMVFSYMQVFSAVCVIFAHGAGEVGYMSGPLGAIWQVVRAGSLLSNSSPPIWTVIIGALGLVIGLGTYGYQVTRAMGSRLAKLTPSRGFSAELSTSLIIMVAAQYGLPTSSSQCITGGIIGVALCEGKTGLNYKYFLETFSSWIITMISMAALTAFFFAQGAFAPSVQMARIIGYYEEALSTRAELLFRGYQRILANSGYNTGDSNEVFAAYLSQTISNVGPGQYYNYQFNPEGFYPHVNAPAVQTPAPWQMVGYLDAALALLGTVVAANPNGLMMCTANIPTGTAFSSRTGYEVSAANFPWYKSMRTATAKGPCTSTPTLNTTLPATQVLTVPTLAAFDPIPTLCSDVPLPACGAVSSPQPWIAVFSAVGAYQSSITGQVAQLQSSITTQLGSAGVAYFSGSTPSITLTIPTSFSGVTAPSFTTTSTICTPAGAPPPPACSSGIVGDVVDGFNSPVALAQANAIVATTTNVTSTYLAALATSFSSFTRAVNTTASAYRSSVATSSTAFLRVATPRLTLANFLGPNPNCPPNVPVCVDANGNPASRFVNAAGNATTFQGFVPPLFSPGRTFSLGSLPSGFSVQGHVTLDQIRNGNPGTSITIFGRPSTTAGTAVCLQPPCNVAYIERAWYNGR